MQKMNTGEGRVSGYYTLKEAELRRGDWAHMQKAAELALPLLHFAFCITD